MERSLTISWENYLREIKRKWTNEILYNLLSMHCIVLNLSVSGGSIN